MKTKLSFLTLALIAGFTGSAIYHWAFPPKETVLVTNQTQYVPQQTSYSGDMAFSAAEDFSNASSLSTPSVVFIQCVSTVNNAISMFDLMFGGSSTNQVASSGSGVIYTNDGYIITNNHVIEKAEKIEVVIDKKNYPATVVGRDPNTDLAVLKINEKNLPVIKIGTAKTIKVGEWVLAIGNPFNLYSTATAGIVSAKARNLNIVNSQFPIESFIQTDAAINPGNSGGALVNIKGELIGINTAILSRTGSYTGYGFAVPIDIVKKVVNDIIAYGEVQKAFGGLEIAEIDNNTAVKLKLDNRSGVIISYLQKEGAAEKAGLKKGDIIVKLNDTDIDGKSAFDEQMSYLNPGDKVTLTYRSGGATKTATLVLTNREGTTEILKRETINSTSLGAELEAVSKVERDKRGLTSGVRISTIRNGLFRQLGISEGFIVTAINRYPVNTPDELIEILEKIRGRVIIDGINTNGTRAQYNFYI